MRVDVPIRVTDSNIRHDNSNNSNMPKLNKGDSVLAQVVSKNGDIITLQRPDGTRMVANVMSDVILSLGDEINMTVLGSSGRQVMMQLNTVDPGTVELENNNLKLNPFVTLETQVSHIFKNMGLKAGQQVMDNVMNLLQQNEGLSPRAAIFMVLNNIEPTAQNIETINNMQESNIGTKLTQIVNQIISQNENIDNGLKLVDTSTANSNAANTNTASSSTTNNSTANTNVVSEQNVQSNTPNAQPNAQHTQNVSGNMASETPQTTQNTISNENAVQSDKAGQQTNQSTNITNEQTNDINNNQTDVANQTKGSDVKAAINPTIADESKSTGAQQKTQSNAGGAGNISDAMETSKPSADEAKVLVKVLSLFNKISSDNSLENKVFDSKEEMQTKLIELKEMVKNSDIKNKETILSKAENILMEKNIESDINRFTYLQIPINNQQNTQTAEVFVYRRKNRKNEADSEHFSILLGLDTINLGRIETLVKFDKNKVSLKMSNENKKASNLIKKYASSLGEELKEIGFNLVGIKVEDLYEKTTIVNAEETLMRMDTNDTRRVDYRI